MEETPRETASPETMAQWNGFEVPGVLLGMPYDFRKPNGARFRERVWNKGGPLFAPHVWGWGFGMNMRNPWSWPLAAVGIGLALFIELYVKA